MAGGIFGHRLRQVSSPVNERLFCYSETKQISREQVYLYTILTKNREHNFNKEQRKGARRQFLVVVHSCKHVFVIKGSKSEHVMSEPKVGVCNLFIFVTGARLMAKALLEKPLIPFFLCQLPS